MKPRAVVLSLILTLAFALLAAPLPSPAQQPGTVYRIGFLWGGAGPSPADTTPNSAQ